MSARCPRCGNLGYVPPVVNAGGVCDWLAPSWPPLTHNHEPWPECPACAAAEAAEAAA
jgi:hypothetical protein